MEPVSIRRFRDEDVATTAQIFFDAVQIGARNHYDEAQRQAWAPSPPQAVQWRDRLASQTTLVAEQNGHAVGFISLSREGCIDLAFVAPNVMGTGVAAKLYRAILAEAKTMSLTRLRTAASHLARNFFERQGWSVIKKQTVTRNGVQLTNFVMEILLT